MVAFTQTPPQPAPSLMGSIQKTFLGGQRSRSEDFPLPLSSGHTIQDMVLRSQHCGCQRGTSAWRLAVKSDVERLKGYTLTSY